MSGLRLSALTCLSAVLVVGCASGPTGGGGGGGVDDEGCAHTHCFNCYRKGQAFWWMMARIAGWEGE